LKQKYIFVFNNDSLIKLRTLTKKSLIYRHDLQDKLISDMQQFNREYMKLTNKHYEDDKM